MTHHNLNDNLYNYIYGVEGNWLGWNYWAVCVGIHIFLPSVAEYRISSHTYQYGEILNSCYLGY